MAKLKTLAWGQKITAFERGLVFAMCERLQLSADYLMSCIAFESGESFSPSKRNAAGSGAVGLIQFMPATARSLGTTTDRLAAMTFAKQLVYVERYFEPNRGRLVTLPDLYMAILWPKGIGKADSWPLWSKAGSPITFRQNSGLDANGDGVITKAEAASKVQAKLIKGVKPPYVWSGQ